MDMFRQIFLVTALAAGLNAFAGEENGAREGNCKIAEKNTDLSVELTIDVKSASLEKGLEVEVKMKNIGAPLTLDICPEMKLCCVLGMHPLIGYNNTGVGLCDTCEAENPERHTSYLPEGASLVFMVDIPADCLPEAALQKDQEITVQFCYELGADKIVNSNKETVTLK